MKLKTCLIICFGLLFGGFKAFALVEDVTSNPKKPILVSQAAPEFALKLELSAGTGYNWYLDVEHSSRLPEPIGYENHSPDAQLMGAPHYQQFNFKLPAVAFKAPQVLHLTFKLMRPWEEMVQASAHLANGDNCLVASSDSVDDTRVFTIVTEPQSHIVKRGFNAND